MKPSRPYQLGVMQGRLLPKYQGRYQAHPVGTWREEFSIAANVGLDLIEFILDYDEVEKNPLMSKQGTAQIQDASAESGVLVRTICADYFMVAPLHKPETMKASMLVLETLVGNAAMLGVKDIVLPCVDASSLRSMEDQDALTKPIQEIMPLMQEKGMNLSLETDLEPGAFRNFLDRFEGSCVRVNYDTGNSASLGFSPTEEFQAYGSLVTDIHIKDRILGGGPTELGTGAANFKEFFQALSTIEYRGPFIMQAYRDDEGLAIFKKQLTWIRPRLDEFYGSKSI